MKTSVNAAKAAKVRIENILSVECCATKVAVTRTAVTKAAVTRVVETRVVETTTKAYLTRRPASVQRSKARAYVRTGRMSGLGHFIVEQSQNLKPTPTVTTF